MNRVSLRFTKKSNVARVAASSSHLWPERRPKRSSDALRRRDVRFLSIDPAHARFRSLFLHRVNDKRVPASVSRSHRASPSPSRAHVARVRPFVRPPRARIPRRLVRRPRTLMMMNGRPNSSNASDMVPSRAAGLIVRRRRRRSIDRPTDRPTAGAAGWFTYSTVVVFYRLQTIRTSATDVVYDAKIIKRRILLVLMCVDVC